MWCVCVCVCEGEAGIQRADVRARGAVVAWLWQNTHVSQAVARGFPSSPLCPLPIVAHCDNHALGRATGTGGPRRGRAETGCGPAHVTCALVARLLSVVCYAGARVLILRQGGVAPNFCGLSELHTV
jgi:hypothetical protein